MKKIIKESLILLCFIIYYFIFWYIFAQKFMEGTWYLPQIIINLLLFFSLFGYPLYLFIKFLIWAVAFLCFIKYLRE
jgi:hypothetical protein